VFLLFCGNSEKADSVTLAAPTIVGTFRRLPMIRTERICIIGYYPELYALVSSVSGKWSGKYPKDKQA
jgi:hypothetical protein